MYFESLAELWHMAGHGAFVWSAYGISALVLLGIIVQPMLRFKIELKRLQTMPAQNNNSGAVGGDNIAENNAPQSSAAKSSTAQPNLEQANAHEQPGVKS